MRGRNPIKAFFCLLLLATARAMTGSRTTYLYNDFKEMDPQIPETFHCNISDAEGSTLLRANTYYEAVAGFSQMGQAMMTVDTVNSAYFIGQHDPLYAKEGAFVVFELFTPDDRQPSNASIHCKSGAGDKKFAYGFG